TASGQRIAKRIEGLQNLRRGLQCIDARRRHRGVSCFAVDDNLEMQTSVVCSCDGIGKARAYCVVGLAQTMLKNPSRANCTSDFLVEGEVKLDRTVQRWGVRRAVARVEFA